MSENTTEEKIVVDENKIVDATTTVTDNDESDISIDIEEPGDSIEIIHQDEMILRDLYNKAYMKDGELCIPGMEGIFTRALNVIYNIFQSGFNYYTSLLVGLEATFKNDWVLYCRRWIKLLQDNPPESEAFSGNPCLRGTKQRTEQHIACLTAVVNFANNLDKEIISKDKAMMTRGIQNVVNYLSANHCTVDISRPSRSKAPSRFTYGDIGRLGTMGYGNEPIIFLNTISRYLDRYADLYKQLVNTAGVEKAIQRMEQEIRKLESSSSNDKKMMEATEMINNIRGRFTAFRAIMRAATDMYQTTLITDFILPLQNMGTLAGWRDDLFTWILATRE